MIGADLKHNIDAMRETKQLPSFVQVLVTFEQALNEIKRLEHTQMTTDYVSLSQAAALQAQNADKLDMKCTQFTNALLRSMSLIDELLRENARLCAASGDPPNVRLFAAKNSFDVAMHRLLGDDLLGDHGSAATTTDTTEINSSLTISTEGEVK